MEKKNIRRRKIIREFVWLIGKMKSFLRRKNFGRNKQKNIVITLVISQESHIF